MARKPKLPETMRAIALDSFGGPEVLKLRTLPVPSVGAFDVLIAVHTAGVGSWDPDLRGGWSANGKTRFPLVLGSDGSGTIAAVGARVSDFKIGERVYAYSFDNPKGGFYAEYVAVPASKVARIPKPLDLEHAGAVPATGLTALQGIDDALELDRGDRVVIHGASGGVGTLAVQFAKLRGARVLASASGKDGVALVRRLGANAAVDGQRADLAAAAGEFAPDGVNAIFAVAGGKPLNHCLETLRADGRIAYPNGVEPEPKRRKGVKTVAYDAAVGVNEFERLNRAVTAVKLKVPIAVAYPLADAAKAHQRLERGHVLGRVVLRVR